MKRFDVLMKLRYVVIILFFLLTINNEIFPQGFLKVDNKIIVKGSGEEFYPKGIGLGGWLLQEGYMLHTSGFANAQWQIRERIVDLIGETNTEIFYETYRNNYVRKVDIDSLKSWGFNSIRLPFHYNLFAINSNPPVFINKGFEIIDSLLSWCEANQIYLVLDMHAAPGGQSDEPISDYNPALPSLWESEQNKDLTVQVWRKIAERYQDKEWIGGYDLLNEPKWELPPNNQPLRDIYIRLTDTIRAVDTNHIIFIEGNWFATDFNGLTPAWDDNMVYSFHKYWNENNQGSIQGYVNLRNSTNRPLWLGETGENSNRWFTDLVELLKTNNIGWAWWPHKKIKSIAGPLSALLIPAYQTLLNYWNGQGSRPTAAYAFNALMNQSDYLKLENCIFNKDVIDALVRQPFNSEIIPYANNQVPGKINAVNFDLGKLNYSYNDLDNQNTGNGSWNTGSLYRNDGVDIESCSNPLSNGYNVGWIQNGEWLNYSLNIVQPGIYNIILNLASPSGGGYVVLLLDDKIIGSAISVPATGGWQNWRTTTLNNIHIPEGIHKLTVKFLIGGFNLSHIDFELVSTAVNDNQQLLNQFSLQQNYPNPFNPKTTISFSTASDGNITIKLIDILGNEVLTLLDEYRQQGKYQLDFNSINLPSGIYFYRMKAGKFLSVKKMMILR